MTSHMVQDIARATCAVAVHHVRGQASTAMHESNFAEVQQFDAFSAGHLSLI